MDSRLEAHIDEIFKDVPKTEKLVVMINRIKSKANAKYLQVREQGYSRNVAYTEVENWITKAKVIVDEEVKNYNAAQAGSTPVSAPTSAPAVPAPLNVQNINDMPAVVVERTTPQDKPKQAAPAPVVTPISAPAPVAAPIPAPVAPAQKNVSHAAPVSNDELSDILGKKKVKDKKAEKPEKRKKEKAKKATDVSPAPVAEVETIVEEPTPFIAPIEPTPSFPTFVAPLPSVTPSFQVPVAKYEEPVNLAEEQVSPIEEETVEEVEEVEKNIDNQTVCPTETSEYRCKGVVGKIFGAVAILLGLGAAVLVILKFLG